MVTGYDTYSRFTLRMGIDTRCKSILVIRLNIIYEIDIIDVQSQNRRERLNGNMRIHNKNGYNLWRLALLAWFIGGVGGVSIDIDHVLSTLTKGAVPWGFLHVPATAFILIGGAIASLGGLVFSLVLTDGDEG
jgi:hypothetical protein